jgi:hypothetical protein
MRYLIAVVAVLLIALASVEDAYAYLDPATGSMVVQGLLAIVGGLVATIGSYRQKILARFRSSRDRKK